MLLEKSYITLYQVPDRAAQEMLHYNSRTKVFNCGRPIYVVVANTGNDEEDAKTEPTLREHEQLQALGVHITQQLMAGSRSAVANIWRRTTDIKSEFVVPKCLVIEKTPACEWKAGVFHDFDKPNKDLIYPDSTYPSLQALARALCKLLAISGIDLEMAELPMVFPTAHQRAKGFRAATKPVRVSQWQGSTNVTYERKKHFTWRRQQLKQPKVS
jgi:hypothetical protein